MHARTHAHTHTYTHTPTHTHTTHTHTHTHTHTTAGNEQNQTVTYVKLNALSLFSSLRRTSIFSLSLPGSFAFVFSSSLLLLHSLYHCFLSAGCALTAVCLCFCAAYSVLTTSHCGTVDIINVSLNCYACISLVFVVAACAVLRLRYGCVCVCVCVCVYVCVCVWCRTNPFEEVRERLLGSQDPVGNKRQMFQLSTHTHTHTHTVQMKLTHTSS